MIRVMIVDDEYLVRERLKHGLNWPELGCLIAAEADNGEDALELLAEREIQLAVVDINMPILDGLAFASKARELYPPIKIIILTGYGTFEYAKTALKAGANDYLLKPVDTAELGAAITALSEQIRHEENERNRNASMQQQLQESHDILRRQFLRKLLAGGSALPDPDQLALYCPALSGSGFIVLAASPDQFGGSPEEKPASVYAVLSDCFAALPGLEILADEEGFTVIADADPSYMNSRLDNIMQTCRVAMKQIRNAGASTVTIGIGQVKEGWDGIAASFREALAAAAYRTLQGGDRIIRFQELPAPKPAPQLSALREDLLIQLRLGSLDGALETIGTIFARFRSEETTLEYLYLLLSELVIALKLHASETGMSVDAELADSFDPPATVRQLETLEQIEAWIAGLYTKAIGASETHKRSTPARLVEKAKRFIDASYADPSLDLNAIAASLHINPSYLSRIFTKETGVSVVTYLTRIRMDKAKELLQEGCQNLTYLAEQIGFTDTQYFSKCFKKQFGLPPSRFMAKEP
ncbi:response regulator [Paenibacillus sp. GCM10027626]|uniref:response regulator n=1 Tax=Paenibacillus sp. GCM10027626 TaxID=3273411 RepID=UPI003640E639